MVEKGETMFYVPKTGPVAGKRNCEAIEKYKKDNPEATGVEIARALCLSLPTVYGHLHKINEHHTKRTRA